MRKHSMPEIKEGGVNVTPLIDVVMCLIIFFMLVAKIGVSSGIKNEIEAPTTYLGVKIADMSNTLALNLYAKGRIDEPPMVLVDLKGDKDRELKFTDTIGGKTVFPLREVLQAMKKDRGEAFKVIVNAKRDMKYQQIQLVLQACAEAGVNNVNFATKKATKPA